MSMVHENMAIPVTFTIGYWAPAYDGTGNGAESYHRLVGLNKPFALLTFISCRRLGRNGILAT